MPSSTPKQAKYMRAIAHGMRGGKGAPSRKVAKEFVRADKRKKRATGAPGASVGGGT